MRTLYETILDISDKQLDASEQHPLIILENIRAVFRRIFEKSLDLGYPAEDTYESYCGIPLKVLELGNISSKDALDKLVKEFMAGLKKIKLKTKITRSSDKEESHKEYWYDISFPDIAGDSKEKLQLTFFISVYHTRGIMGSVFITAPETILQ